MFFKKLLKIHKKSTASEEKYIPLSEAAKYTPYSAEYLSLRARQGKLRAIKVGKIWVTKREWVEEYVRKYQGKEETVKLPTSFFKLPTFKLRFEILFALTLLLFFVSFALAKDSLKIVAKEIVSSLEEIGEDFVIGANLQFSKTGKSFKNVFSQRKEGAEIALAETSQTTQKGLASVSEFFKDYFQWLGEKITKPFKKEKKAEEVKKAEIQKEITIPKEVQEKISSLEEKIKELERKPPLVREIEVERKVVVEPIKRVEVEKITEFIPSEELAKVKSQLSIFGETLRKIQPNPPYTTALTSPIYIQQGIQGGAGIFASLAAESAAFRTLGVGASVTLGSDSRDKLTVNSVSQFNAPITVGQNALTIDTSGNIKTQGSAEIAGNLITQGLTEFKSPFTLTSTSTPQLSIRYDELNKLDISVFSTGAVNVSSTATTTLFAAGNQNQFVLGSNGNVGIGTETPLEKLTISGNILGTGNLTIQGLTSLATTTISTQLTVPKITSLADLTIDPTGNLIISKPTTISANFTVLGTSTLATTTLSRLTITELTPGSVLFAGAGGLISQDNSNLFWDNTNKRLGIGTSTPSQKLDVQGGNINVSGSLMTGGVARIDSSGNLINIGNITLSGTISGTYTIGGTPTLASSLTGSGSPNITGIGLLSATNLTISGTATTTNLNVTGLTNLATTTISTQLSVPLITSPSVLTISPSGNATTTITGPVILASQTGNVGIGTTAPSQRLTVAGNIGIQAGANAFIGTLDNYALSLRTNNTDRVFITNAGNVGIGTTSPSAAKLHLAGTDTEGYTATIRLQNQNSGGADAFITASDSYWLAGANKLLFGIGGMPASANVKMVLDSSGNVGIGTTAPVSLLELYKTNASPILTITSATSTTYSPQIAFRTGATPTTKFTLGVDISTGKLKIVPSSDITTSTGITIDSSGNVGIGTTAPGVKLDVVGSVRTDSTPLSGHGLYGKLNSYDTRSSNYLPEQYYMGAVLEFKNNSTIGLSGEGTYSGLLTYRQWSSGTDWSGGGVHQLAFGSSGNIWHRYSQTTGSWGSWARLLDTANVVKTSNVLQIDGTGNSYIMGNVGIGTTAPGSKLTISGASYFGYLSTPSGVTAATTTGGNFSATGTYYYVVTALDSNNLSSAKSSEVSCLIDPTSTACQISWSSVSGAAKYRVWRGTSSGGENQYFETTATSYTDTGTTGTSGTPPSSPTSAYFAGNVGIGTTAPSAKLQVVGGAIMPAVGNSASAGIYFPPNPGGGGGDEAFIRYYVESGETTKLLIGINNDPDDRLSLYQYGAERLTIYNGNVGIGTTAPSSRLTIAAGATNGEFAIGNFNAKVVDDMEDVTDWSSSDGTYTPISLESTNVKVGNYALKISTTVSNSNGDTVTKTISNENWSSYGKLGFWIKASYTTTSTDATTSQIISVQFNDTSGGTYTRNITIKEFDQWQYEEWDISSLTRSSVSWIRFRIDNDYGSPVFYIDQIRLYSSTERTGEIFVDKSGSLVIMGRNTTEIYAPNSSSGQLPGLKVGPAVTEVNQPLSVNVGGDVGLSYDLIFLNTGLSSITSEGGLQILAGAPYRIANLTLGTRYNPGARDSGTSSGSNTATTLNDTSKSWATSTWVGGAVRITAGTGAGQVRAICANTPTQITVCDSWTTIPDTTSKYEIIGMPTGGDVIVDIGGANFASGGFKIFGADEGGAVFRVSPTGDVEIGSSGGWGEGKLIVKGGIILRGGNLQANKLSAPTGLNSTTQNSGGSLSGAVATYYYKVTAINDDGTETTPSATRAQSLTPLSAPTPSLTVNTTGTTYYAYRVAVYTSNGTSTPSNSVTTDIGADPPNNTISWSAVSGASGYILYRQKATTTADWEWIDMGTSTSYTDTLSTWPATTTLPTLNNARTNTNIITLTWNVVPGAKGYKVYRGTDDVWGNADDRLVDNGVIFTNQVVDDGVGDSSGQVSPPTTNTTGGDLTIQGYITMASSTYQTLVTRVKAGAPTEADANGALVVDSSNGRFYFRYGDTWHYVAQTAGFEIPANEIYDPITGQLISEGDFVLGWINEIKSDSARHGLWVRFDTVKDKIFNEFKEKIKNEFKFSIDDSGYLVVEKIKAKEIKAEKICLDDICITKEELRQLLESRNKEVGSMNGGGERGGTNQETTTTTTTTESTPTSTSP